MFFVTAFLAVGTWQPKVPARALTFAQVGLSWVSIKPILTLLLWSFFLCFPEFLSFFSAIHATDSSFFLSLSLSLFFFFFLSSFSLAQIFFFSLFLCCYFFFSFFLFFFISSTLIWSHATDLATLTHPCHHPHQVALFSFPYLSFCFFVFFFFFFVYRSSFLLFLSYV